VVGGLQRPGPSRSSFQDGLIRIRPGDSPGQGRPETKSRVSATDTAALPTSSPWREPSRSPPLALGEIRIGAREEHHRMVIALPTRWA
jgi:hypothetical protein